MGDALDTLRIEPSPASPDGGFAQRLLGQVTDALDGPATFDLAMPKARVVDDEVLDEALEIVRGTAPEFDPFGRGFCIANHAPMTADALCELGRPDAVIERTLRYRKYLIDAPRPWNPIPRDDWRAALGDYNRAGDWVVLFDRELAEAPWAQVLDRWVPRLAAGSVGSGTHGILRAAHAARALGRAATRYTASARRPCAARQTSTVLIACSSPHATASSTRSSTVMSLASHVTAGGSRTIAA